MAGPGRVDVTKDSIGGAAPITSIELADDGGLPLAADWRNVAAMALKNQFGAGFPVKYAFAETPATPFVIGPPNTFSGNTWTNSKVTLSVPNVKIGDEIEVIAWGNWQLNASTAAGNVAGRSRIEIIEDVGGAAVAAHPIGMGTIYDDSGALALPHNEPYSISVKHTVANAGTVSVTLQVRSEDLTGGGGTATIILMFTARMDVNHLVKS